MLLSLRSGVDGEVDPKIRASVVLKLSGRFTEEEPLAFMQGKLAP
jgi:hypothetical protein